MSKLFRVCLLLAATLLPALTAAAQDSLATRPAQPAAPVVVAAATPPVATVDTAEALHRFFATKRTVFPVVAAVSVGLYALGVSSQEHNGWAGLGNIVLFTVAEAALLPALLVHSSQYGRRHEQEALDDYRQHRLPRRLARRLKPQYFVPKAQPAPAPPTTR